MKDLTPARKSLDPIEIVSRDEIEALQLERMQWSLRHAYDNVPFYKKSFDEKGVHPDDLKSLKDLAKFPFTLKTDLRDHYPFGMFAVPREQVRRVHASSGTTGKPTVVGYTEKDLDTWATVMARSMRASGTKPGDIVHISYGYGLFTGGLGAHYGAEKLGCTVVPVSGGMTARQVTLIEDFGATTIMVTPSYVLAILDEYRAQGLDPAKSPLEVGIFGAEPWTNAMRQEIEQTFDMHAVDIYGLSEVMGPGVANECVETKDGLHIWEDHFYPEVINPETGEPVADGEMGELVFTSLTKEAFPVILGQSWRMMVAGIVAYAVSLTLNIWIFSRLQRADGRFVGLRGFVAAALSQIVDTVVFITISFYGVRPIAAIMAGQMTAKVVLSAVLVPAVIWLVVKAGRRMDAG